MTTVDTASFFFSTVGYHAILTIIDSTVYIFLAFHILLALASISLSDIEELVSTVANCWIVGPTIFMYLPPLIEGALEFGGLVEGFKRTIV